MSSAWQEMTFALPPAHECQMIVPLPRWHLGIASNCPFVAGTRYSLWVCFKASIAKEDATGKKRKNTEKGLSDPLCKPLAPLKHCSF